MWSASRTVLSRCAMSICTHGNPARLALIRASVAASRWLDASSSKSTAGWRTIARASASRCRWPPDRPVPRCATWVR